MALTRKPKDIKEIRVEVNKGMTQAEQSKKLTDAQAEQFQYGYEAGTYSHNLACNMQKSRRKKMRATDCDALARKDAMRNRLKTKLK